MICLSCLFALQNQQHESQTKTLTDDVQQKVRRCQCFSCMATGISPARLSAEICCWLLSAFCSLVSAFVNLLLVHSAAAGGRLLLYVAASCWLWPLL